MTNYDIYDVYDNTTNRVIACGSWSEVKGYCDCERYTIVSRMNGQIISWKGIDKSLLMCYNIDVERESKSPKQKEKRYGN